SSSASSRSSAVRRLSPRARLPPGNSQNPAMCVPGRRWLTSTRPCASSRMPTRTCTSSSARSSLIERQSSEPPVALLVFLPGPARARLVPADLALLAHVRRQRLRGHARGDGRRRRMRVPGPRRDAGRRPRPRRAERRARLRPRRRDEGRRLRVLCTQSRRIARRPLHGLHVLRPADLDLREDRDGVVLHAVEHAREHLERLALVLLLRVTLRVTAQVDALTQVIQRREMLLPVHVELAQHHALLQLAHDRLADRLDLLLVLRLDALEDQLAEPLLVERVVLLERLRDVELETELALERLRQALLVPHLLDAVGGDVLVDDVLDDLRTNPADRVRDVLGVHQLGALLVDDLALIVGDVVVLEELL